MILKATGLYAFYEIIPTDEPYLPMLLLFILRIATRCAFYCLNRSLELQSNGLVQH